MLVEYEDLNSDLPQSTRRQMAIFALAPTVGVEALEELFGVSLGQTPFRHRSWFWWNALRFSQMPQHWDALASARNDGVRLDECLRDLRDKTTDDQWETLSYRIGVPVLRDREIRLNPSWYRDYEPGRGPRVTIWTKGGTWWKTDNFTKLLLLDEHLGPRPGGNAWCKRLGPDGVKRIERELHGLIDPDKILAPKARRRATEYVRERIVEVLGYDYERKASYRTAAWFFQARVLDPDGRVYRPRMAVPWKDVKERPRTETRSGREWRWEWMPDA